MEFYFGFIGIMTAGNAFTLKHETIIEFPVKIVDKQVERQIENLVNAIILEKSNHDPDTDDFENLMDCIAYELYFPDIVRLSGCEVIKHLPIIPELSRDWDQEKLRSSIDKIHKEIKNQRNPLIHSMKKIREIEEVKIIEGKI